MSDLAPLVVAVLRDKTVVDLKEENDNLKKIIHAQLMLQITGTNRSPIHFEISLKSITEVEGATDGKLYYQIDFLKSCKLTVGSLWNMEIWLGGNLLEVINSDVNNRFHFACCPSERNDSRTVLVGGISCNHVIESIAIFFGTMSNIKCDATKEDYDRTTRLRESKRILQGMSLQKCSIQGMYLRANEISGILSLLKSAGVSVKN
eukprot:CAMPEP_0170863706 /NCGR_PEP_ID=MMETSP0734-20130129/19922_1 /TAXON_ID=186038 /ORGANISM="Fragilariopsis kerguelensis, Strain L26-C5" /LENGTH=204 /DNA_ID=CAMNT_0011238935 /DNA_START=31 /DNA_END=645 /DNA_ORIENTATION=-